MLMLIIRLLEYC